MLKVYGDMSTGRVVVSMFFLFMHKNLRIIVCMNCHLPIREWRYRISKNCSQVQKQAIDHEVDPYVNGIYENGNEIVTRLMYARLWGWTSCVGKQLDVLSTGMMICGIANVLLVCIMYSKALVVHTDCMSEWRCCSLRCKIVYPSSQHRHSPFCARCVHSHTAVFQPQKIDLEGSHTIFHVGFEKWWCFWIFRFGWCREVLWWWI